MEQFVITIKDGNLHVEGYPDAVKVLKLTDRKSKRLGELFLHLADIDYAIECLEAINQVQENPIVLRMSLWRSAITYYIKCYGNNGSRFGLEFKKIFKGDKGAAEAHDYFTNLRNKHLIHDENSYAQALPGAILNKHGMDTKIAKVVCIGAIGDTLTPGDYSNLHRLAATVRSWLTLQFDELCEKLSSELEHLPYGDLMKMDSLSYSKPDVGEVNKRRTRDV